MVAVPAQGAAVAGFAPHTRPLHEVRRWSEAHASRVPRELPPLVWIGAPDVVRHARIDPEAATIAWGDRSIAMSLVDRLPQNSAWLDASTSAWLASHSVQVRGVLRNDAFAVRALWPEAFVIGPEPPPRRALPDALAPGLRLRAWIRGALRADAPFDAFTAWQRADATSFAGRFVLAFVLNGAQGDDDEAHAGHFAVATGRIADDGSVADWLVNNFYSLDSESEKGILAAPVPLASYQGDLNAGQAWYRPTWIVAAVLDGDRAVLRVQAALSRVFLQFWRHQWPYYHPTDNCTSISVETLRELGFDVPLRGATSRLGALASFPLLLARERSLDAASTSYDYLVTELTRLLPAIATEAVVDALFALAGNPATAAGMLGRELADEMSAIVVARIPQFPSSRAFGAAPVESLGEYRKRVPRDPAQRKIIPLAPRPFPEALRDPDLLPPLPRPSQRARRLWVAAPVAAAAIALVLARR